MRILTLHRELPFPADNGGRLRAAHMALDLACHHDTVLLAFDSPDREVDPLFPERSRFREVELIPRPRSSSRIQRFLSRVPSEVNDLASVQMAGAVARVVQSFQPDVILISEPALTPYLLPYQDRALVLDYLMVTTLSLERLGDLASGWRRLVWRARWKKADAYHRRIASLFDLCLVNSQEDHDDLVANCDRWRRLEFFPNGLRLDDYPLNLAQPEPATLIYPGSVAYPPNRDAVEFMIQEILPLVRRQVPDTRLLVTGAVDKVVPPPQGDGVVYTGRVPDIRPTIAAAWACVVPLRSGAGGTRFKLLESMALGTPLVSTSIGAEGIDWTDGKNILIADHAEAFAERTIELLQSESRRHQVSNAGRQLMEEKYDWNVLGAKATAMLEEIVDAKARDR